MVEEFGGMVKLNNRQIAWIVKKVSSGKVKTRAAAQIYGVSQRRVQQLAKEYSDSGEIPRLKKKRRPRTYLTEEQKRWVDEVWEETRLGSKLLYYELRRRGLDVPKNKLIAYLRETGRSKPNKNLQKKRKRCRYERKHSCSLVHGDWHRRTENDPHAIIWLDDASRKILACGEFSEATTEHSIETLLEAIEHANTSHTSIRQVNTDRGTQFYSNKKKPSRFEQFLTSQGIQFIPSRKQNPQTNGKLERHWLEYDRHRPRFNNIQEYADWYNHRIHGALWVEIGENPEEAFIRKLPPESIIGIFFDHNPEVNQT